MSAKKARAAKRNAEKRWAKVRRAKARAEAKAAQEAASREAPAKRGMASMSPWKGLDDEPKVVPVRVEKMPGRNAKCPCGSGRKYKQCCGLSPKNPTSPRGI